MSKQLRVGCSPLTGNIYAGRLCVDGRTWRDGKQDVTIEALLAVAQHVENFGKPVTLYDTTGSGPSYEIAVKRIEPPAADLSEQKHNFWCASLLNTPGRQVPCNCDLSLSEKCSYPDCDCETLCDQIRDQTRNGR